MGFFSRVFGNFGSRSRVTGTIDPQRVANAEMVAMCLTSAIPKCLAIDGLTAENVPTSQQFTTPKCLGSLMGLSAGIFEQAAIEPTGDAPFEALETAIYLVFGRGPANELALKAVEHLKQGHPEFVAVMEFSRRDAAAIFSDGPSSWVAYHLALHDMI